LKKTAFIFWMILTVFVGQAVAEEFFPSNILMMDEKFAHHVILVEKATHKIHIFENNKTVPKLLKTFNMATGKQKGDKVAEGDHKTPEGIYTMYEFLSKDDLLKRHGKAAEIYGSGAFPMNYPNFIDERAHKTGGGIWLHSTDNDNRIFKGLDSRGCVVVQNNDLKEISQYIELNATPIIVVQDIFFLSQTTWERNRKDISEAVAKWTSAWQNKNFDQYIAAYDIENFHDNSKGNYNSYKTYKKAVFSRPDSPQIKFSDISILSTEEYAVVYLEQDYRSSIINDVGRKTLYLKKNSGYDWKIVGELWSKLENSNASFVPSKRFFKD
jgi:murein L,D-transpeptidase YafK